MTKRGLNLGCGRIILPCEQPAHHRFLPSEIYTDPAIRWDNADLHANDGVNLILDAFDYPWKTEQLSANGAYSVEWEIPDNTYDVVLAAHLIEHIPHVVTRNGQFAKSSGGWWAWWDELGRVLKPDGVAYVLFPYGWSNGGLMDPTHTRYLTLEAFGYFAPNPDAPFDYHLKHLWDVMYGPMLGYSEHGINAAAQAGIPPEARGAFIQHMAKTRLNIITEVGIGLRVNKDAGISRVQPATARAEVADREVGARQDARKDQVTVGIAGN